MIIAASGDGILISDKERSGYRDGVGSREQLNGPNQGVFVKNPEYAGEPIISHYSVSFFLVIYIRNNIHRMF